MLAAKDLYESTDYNFNIKSGIGLFEGAFRALESVRILRRGESPGTGVGLSNYMVTKGGIMEHVSPVITEHVELPISI